ncbi:MAG: glycoside hydrolase family 16 protein, partial [Alloprevotella sp.]|nr:glycoside hydrolase family 16 protein [Alloprevotella sp.]
TYNHTDRCLQKISLGSTTLDVARMASTDNPVYTDLMPQSFHVKAGETLTPRFTYAGTWMHGYVYVDFGNDGRFSVELNANGTPAEGSDVVAYSCYKNKNSAGSNVTNENVLQPPTFTLPADMPTGFYRMRYKVDWNEIDAGGNVSESNHIINNGGAIVDVRLNVHEDMVNVNDANRNGEVLAEDGTKLSSYQTPFGQPFTIRMNPERGFTYDGIRLRHGYNLSGDSLVHGTPQYVDTVFPRSSFTDDVFTIPAEYVDGDMEIEGLFVEDGSQKPDDPDPEYQLVFNDEFEQPDGSQPDPEKWSSSARRNAVWNRFVADDDRVVFIEDGALVCRAIRNPDRSTDDVAMLTGSRETQGKFSFTYGKVEVRLKTLRHRGNFPAAWMMPEPPAEGWPNGGEIDIFETIDDQDRAWHTVHSNWTHNLGYKNNPASTFNEPCTVEDWHVYGLEWTEDEIKWTVDGKQVGYYFKAPGQSALDQGQWPFNHPFYIILNQSVGNGSWAAMYDEDFTYETRFDYVRVYQKQGIDGIQGVQLAQPGDNAIYDLQGRRVSTPQRGGLYIRNGKKFIR